MDGGEKIYPREGINDVLYVFKDIQKTYTFSEDDVLWAYDIDEADRTEFPSIDDLKKALTSAEMEQLILDAYGVSKKIEIQEEEVKYPISDEFKESVNQQYNNKDFLEPVGDILHETYDSRYYRRNRYFEIYGRYPD